MIALKLAWRNLMGAGLRTWLNVIVLSLSFVTIIWHRGFLDGWDRQARRDTIAWEIAAGQYWAAAYDQYDPFTLIDSHEKIPQQLNDQNIVPVLIAQGTIYPEGRMQSVLLKGIPTSQELLAMPSALLDTAIAEIPAMIGTRMAKSSRLKPGDLTMVRWRDANGTFDATEIRIVGIFKTDVQTLDNMQIWLPLDSLQKMMQMPGEATIISSAQPPSKSLVGENWKIKTRDELLSDIDNMLEQKKAGGSFLYLILISLAMLAIFDTQVLAIFRRQKEIGTHIALGMTRGQVIRLFTFEGTMHGILAAFLGAIYGIPLLTMQAKYGFSLPASTDNMGLTIAERIYPYYSVGLIFGTTVIVLFATMIVSFLPTRRIAKLNPTDALRGKVQ